MTIAAMMLQAAVPAATDAERLSAPMPAGFKSAYSAAQGGQTIEERVPTAETVEDWSRMITLQRFGGIAAIGPHGILDRLGGLLVQACPGTVVTPIVDQTEDGRPVASFRVDCPLNPTTGKPETMFARAFQGGSDLHLVQYAFRSVPKPGQVKEVNDYLTAVRLCPAAIAACATP